MSIDLEKFFDDKNRHTKVTRGELKEIIAYFIDKGTFAQAMDVLHFDIKQAIKKEVEEEMGAFMIALQSGEETSEAGIITLTK